MQFVVLSDQNAEDFVTRTTVPIFRDPTTELTAWSQTQPGSRKHDTFVYTRDGGHALFWDASSEQLDQWSADIRAAVEAQGK